MTEVAPTVLVHESALADTWAELDGCRRALEGAMRENGRLARALQQATSERDEARRQRDEARAVAA